MSATSSSPAPGDARLERWRDPLRVRAAASKLWHHFEVDRHVESRSRFAVAAIATLAHGLLYGIPNRFPLYQPLELPLTLADRVIPLIALSAWIYWSDYLLVFVAFHKTRAPAHFIRAFALALVLSVATHLLLPTIYPRALFPLGDDAATFTGGLLARFRDLDQATSCFPSLHVAVATLSALSARGTKRWGTVLTIWAVLIAVSTLTTKQHYVYDVAGGALLGFFSWAAAARWEHRHEPRTGPAHP